MRTRFNILSSTTLACISALALSGCSGDPADDDTSPSSTPSTNSPSPTPFPATLDADEDGIADADDCNDHDDTIYPDAVELCDEKDNDCDTDIDEGVKAPYYRDEDGDGFGIESVSTEACSAPSGYSAQAGDCDDGDSKVNPAAVDLIGDLIDLDCDGIDWTQKIAGVGYYNGDGIPASEAALASPRLLAVDSDGNIYIADTTNFRVRKIDSAGIITTVAGNGIQDSNGDGGPALAASIQPYGVTFDAAGNMYISEPVSSRVRMVGSDGIISTVVGTGVEGSLGDGGPASEAQLMEPLGLAWSPRGLFIADASDNKVRMVDDSGTISTFLGTGDKGYSDSELPYNVVMNRPTGVAVDGSGNVFVVDYGNQIVRMVDTDGYVQIVAGDARTGEYEDGIPATSAQLMYPQDVVPDSSGNFYISDPGAHKVRKVDSAGIITTAAGTGESGYSGDGGAATAATLKAPYGMALARDGALLIIDTPEDCLRQVNTAGIISTIAGIKSAGPSPDGGDATSSLLNFPYIALPTKRSTVLFADTENNRVRVVTSEGLMQPFAGTGSKGYSGDGGSAIEASLSTPRGLAIDSSGNVFIGDALNHRVRKVTVEGIISTVAGNGVQGYAGDGGPATTAQLNQPSDLAIDLSGRLYIADQLNYRIRRLEADGSISTVVGTGVQGNTGDGGLATQAKIGKVYGLTVDESNSLLFMDSNRVIRKVAPDGTITKIAGGGSVDPWTVGPAKDAKLNNPRGIAIAPDGSLFFGDEITIRKVDASGTLSTIMGFRSFGTGIQEGPATDMSLFLPYGIAFDTKGDLIIADTYNQRILRLSP